MTPIETIERYARGEIELDLAEYGEHVLAGGSNENFFLSQAIVRVSSHPDRYGVWARFLRSLERIYGPKWRGWAALNVDRPLVCNEDGCTELALNGICDQCLTRTDR